MQYHILVRSSWLQVVKLAKAERKICSWDVPGTPGQRRIELYRGLEAGTSRSLGLHLRSCGLCPCSSPQTSSFLQANDLLCASSNTYRRPRTPEVTSPEGPGPCNDEDQYFPIPVPNFLKRTCDCPTWIRHLETRATLLCPALSDM